MWEERVMGLVWAIPVRNLYDWERVPAAVQTSASCIYTALAQNAPALRLATQIKMNARSPTIGELHTGIIKTGFKGAGQGPDPQAGFTIEGHNKSNHAERPQNSTKSS
eukprot:350556-Chlamydomonas_euryale.AAC.19